MGRTGSGIAIDRLDAPGRSRAVEGLKGDQRGQVPIARRQVRLSSVKQPQATAAGDQLWLF
jgi:hypothetical protein